MHLIELAHDIALGVFKLQGDIRQFPGVGGHVVAHLCQEYVVHLGDAHADANVGQRPRAERQD